MTHSATSLREVCFEYKADGQTFLALRDVHLDIRRGEFVAIIGPSGSGKSTLLNILGLLARPTAGEQMIFGKQVRQLTDAELSALRNKNIGFVFQNFSLVNRLTVLENILLPTSFEVDSDPLAAELYRDRALALLRRFSLHELAERMPNELSGGQKQRVAICRALIMKPNMILADEPTGALDSQSAKEVLSILQQLHQDGHTVVIITHDQDVARLAQRTIVVRDGAIAANEAPFVRSDIVQDALPDSAIRSQRESETRSWLAQHSELIRRSAVLAMRSLTTHRTRSILTGLGLFMGILSLIVIDGLGEIVQNSFNKLFFTSSVRKAYIYYDSGRGRFHGHGRSDWQGLKAEEEFPKLASMFEKKGIIRPFLRSSTCQTKTETGGFRTQLAGISDGAEFLEMDTPLRVGRFPNLNEFSQGAPVAVLGSDTVDQLFDKKDPRRREKDFPVGQRVIVDKCNILGTFSIVGVLNKRDSSFGNRDANDLIYVPTQSILNRKGPTYYTWFSVLPHVGVDPRSLATEIKNYLNMKSNGKLNFDSSIPADILERVRGFLHIVQLIVGFIGLLCLFVGGVGIMNMMLVTVAERTREIGILRSLGARQSHIRSYILVETTVLCVIAGVIAIVVGFLANNLFSWAVSIFVPMLKDFRWIFAPVGLFAGLVVSILCGLGFGSVPAAKAAALDPAECLRAE